MASPNSLTLRGNQLPEVIIIDHNARPKLKSHTGFMKMSVVLCPSLYTYHGEVGKY